MADFKARPPSTFNPVTSDFTSFSEWRQEFDIYVQASSHFAATVQLPTQQARLFNLAGGEFTRFAKQQITVTALTTVNEILDAVATALKPKRFDL